MVSVMPALRGEGRMRTCGYPGCGGAIADGKPFNTRWCESCRKAINQSRIRRWEARQSRGAAIASLAPYQNRVEPRKAIERRAPGDERKAEPKCSWCGSQPWACEPGRYSGDSGEQGHQGEEIAPHWQCLRCGLKYAPEAKLALVCTVRSSAAMAVERAALFAPEPLWSRGKPTGSRKK